MKQSLSAIIPVWNGARFLEDAVSSILAQCYDSLEILVIDDGSTDETAKVAERLQGGDIRYLSLPHRGIVPTRLQGIATARGEILAFLDVDDIWAPNKLERQLGLLDENPDVDIVNGYTQLQRLVDTNGPTMRFENWGEPVLTPSFGSALFRRQAIEEMGLTATEGGGQDLDWYMRAREQNLSVRIHPEVVQYYRRHSTNMTNDRKASEKSVLLMLQQSLARRSAQGKV